MPLVYSRSAQLAEKTRERTRILPPQMILVFFGQFRDLLELFLVLRCQCALLECLDVLFEAEFSTEAKNAIVQVLLGDSRQRIIDSIAMKLSARPTSPTKTDTVFTSR